MRDLVSIAQRNSRNELHDLVEAQLPHFWLTYQPKSLRNFRGKFIKLMRIPNFVILDREGGK